MDTILELLTTLGRFAVGLWPVMFIVLLIGVFKRREGFGTMLRTSAKALIVSWAFFAILRSLFHILKLETFVLIPEPVNSQLFLIVGLFLLPLVVAIVLEERRRHFIVKSIEDMQALSPSDFEQLVADTYRDQGHQVEVVGASGDHGIDLIVRTRRGDIWIVQCKKYRGKVGEPVVRDFYGTLRASHASAGAIVTCGYITDQARLWAEGKPIYLYDGREFLKIIESTRYRRNLPLKARDKLREVAASATPATAAPPAAVGVAAAVAPANPFKNVLQPAMESIYSSRAASSEPAQEAPYETELPDKTPFMDLSNTPDCPVCGVPMVEHTVKVFPFRTKKEYICANAPACSETMPKD
mgnify:CR=1 FL=1